MKAFVLVFLGSGLGGMTRYYLSRLINPNSPYTFPLGTFLINIIACLLLGCIIGYGHKLEPHTKLLLASGFCGGFSTFSAFSGETFLLMQHGQYLQAALYVVSSVVVCIAFTLLGYLIGSSF